MSKERYQIRIQGYVHLDWSDWFEYVDVVHNEAGDTLLTGRLPDQTALYGVMMRLRDLGLTLLEVRLVVTEEDPQKSKDEKKGEANE